MNDIISHAVSNFSVHNMDTAPEKSRPMLEGAQAAFGFLPNLIGVLAESPAVVEAYLALGQIFDKSSLTAAERQVAILAISRYNGCDYCMAAHSKIASMQKVPAEVINSVRNDLPIADAKLQAMHTFATAMVDKRGWLTKDDVSAFLDAGYSNAQILEVVLAATFKTLSNYANHITDTPLDGAFTSQAWQPAEQTAA